MGTPPVPQTGWPFLVASGRRRDYSVLLAPDFLVDDLDYGLLEQVVSPGSERNPARVISAESRGGRRLMLAYVTHLLGAEDIAGPGGRADTPAADPRDEHGRPLRLSYGFAVRNASITDLAQADIDVVREIALSVYRRFLRDEERFAVVPAGPFQIRSRVNAEVRAGTAIPAEGRRSRSTRGRIPRYRAAVWYALAGIVAALALMAVMWSRSPAPSPPDCLDQTGATGLPATTALPTTASSACAPTDRPRPSRSRRTIVEARCAGDGDRQRGRHR